MSVTEPFITIAPPGFMGAVGRIDDHPGSSPADEQARPEDG
jgi:hypothetical protein